MQLLLDEGLPVQLIEPLRRNAPHTFDHIDDLKWKSKKDEFLLPDAAARGYDALVALDVGQLTEPDLCRVLKKSGLHHISLRQGRTVKGKKGLARVIASIVVAMPYVLDDLEVEAEQRIVPLQLLAAGARHEVWDPKTARAELPYWPR
ncbi:MAG TPA: hypothetical protein VNB64_11955 [Solirubrobacteraceae bacterium]|nr:hypothetical protein [Solirubrobacteraceae bacterium]